ncbi:ribonuclease [Clostridium sp. PL3]|uniref:Ribonuclease n=1 Tax=Clostridium thailandense TaxID=2794346 RepID=A0A949U370_9CLOT|nr:ribonuclease domain-containing protein [Clostridium thailandense]MBV7276556.1 ribonuclease [Clostridium thailandense]
MKNNFIQKIFVVFLALFITISLLGCTSTNKNTDKEKQNVNTESVKTDSTKNKKVINDFQGVADYIHKNAALPDNFITKDQATKLGWTPGKDLDKVAPGKSIGGDIFKNAEKSLPDAPKRVWRECDINYNGGKRGADRILYSNDGLIYSTSDHYKTFKLLYNGK